MPKLKKVLEERKKFLPIKAASRATKTMLFEKEKSLSWKIERFLYLAKGTNAMLAYLSSFL